MLDTLRFYEDLAESLEPAAARKIAAAVGAVYEELSQTVTKADFRELQGVVQSLAEAQQRTEARLEQLVEAQQRTEARLEQLAEAQQRTEARLEQLVEAQQRTETEVRALARGLKETRRTLGGISDSVGYSLEDRAMSHLPAFLAEEHQITVEDRLVRRFVEYPDGGMDEINVFGRGRRNGETLTIVGEAKSQPGKRDVDRFLKLVGRLEQHGWLESERFLLLIGYSLRPEVERYARSQGLEVVPSYLLAG